MLDMIVSARTNQSLFVFFNPKFITNGLRRNCLFVIFVLFFFICFLFVYFFFHYYLIFFVQCDYQLSIKEKSVNDFISSI